MQETIYQDAEQNLRIVYSDTLPEGTLDLLILTIWGTTRTLYTENDLPDVFAQSPPGVYFSLMQGDELAGTYRGIPKHVRFRNRTYDVAALSHDCPPFDLIDPLTKRKEGWRWFQMH